MDQTLQRVLCPRCGGMMTFTRDQFGQQVRHDLCGTIFLLPHPENVLTPARPIPPPVQRPPLQAVLNPFDTIAATSLITPIINKQSTSRPNHKWLLWPVLLVAIGAIMGAALMQVFNSKDRGSVSPSQQGQPQHVVQNAPDPPPRSPQTAKPATNSIANSTRKEEIKAFVLSKLTNQRRHFGSRTNTYHVSFANDDSMLLTLNQQRDDKSWYKSTQKVPLAKIDPTNVKMTVYHPDNGPDYTNIHWFMSNKSDVVAVKNICSDTRDNSEYLNNYVNIDVNEERTARQLTKAIAELVLLAGGKGELFDEGWTVEYKYYINGTWEDGGPSGPPTVSSTAATQSDSTYTSGYSVGDPVENNGLLGWKWSGTVVDVDGKRYSIRIDSRDPKSARQYRKGETYVFLEGEFRYMKNENAKSLYHRLRGD